MSLSALDVDVRVYPSVCVHVAMYSMWQSFETFAVVMCVGVGVVSVCMPICYVHEYLWVCLSVCMLSSVRMRSCELPVSCHMCE